MDHKLAKNCYGVGGFDPLHRWSRQPTDRYKKLGDVLVVGLNDDELVVPQKGKPFMDFWQRLDIMANLKWLSHVVPFNDDDSTAQHNSFLISKKITAKIAFTFFMRNGGDQCSNIQERVDGVIQQTGVGGDNKANSSSHIWAKEIGDTLINCVKYPDAKVKLLAT